MQQQQQTWFKWIKYKVRMCVCLFVCVFVIQGREGGIFPFYASFVVERCVLQSKPRCAPPSA